MRRMLWWWFWGLLLYVVPRRRAPDTSWTHTPWYQVLVRSYRHGPGLDDALERWGNLRGIVDALQYIASLGFKVLWLGPIFESPHVDSGYDQSNPFKIQAQYGTTADLDELLDKAHKLGIKVILDYPLHHVSDQHPFFTIGALKQIHADRPFKRLVLWVKHRWYRGFILWCREEEFPNAVNAFPDDTTNKSYLESAGRWYHHTFMPAQADLNFRRLRVIWYTVRVMRYWLKRGVDGFRLDAVRHLYKWGDETCEGLPEVHVYLGWLRWWLDWFFPGRVFVAEANEKPAKLAGYFGRKRSAPRGLKAAVAIAATAVLAATGLSFPATSWPWFAGLLAGALGYLAAFGIGRERQECHVVYGFHVVGRILESDALHLATPMYAAIDEEEVLYHDAPPGALVLEYESCHDDRTKEQGDPVLMVVVQEAADPRRVFNYGVVGGSRAFNGGSRIAWEADRVVTSTFGRAVLWYYGYEIGMGDNPDLDDRDGVRGLMAWGADGYAGW